jgi:hypothetical protein
VDEERRAARVPWTGEALETARTPLFALRVDAFTATA